MSADPYRTLGLHPGASMAEVKRAYRRLAKAFHPDSAGEAALPRFLAIHEAYDAIQAGRPSAARATAPPAPTAGSPGAEPWRADPARARAARERARTSRSQRAGAPGGASSGSPASGAAAGGFSGSSRRSAGSSSTSGSTGGASAPGTSRGRGSGRRRETRKATLGSTSYDEARDPADATWSGASWYGPTSGEYWIVNPREYADPRKHGPDYQSRARRRVAGVAGAAAEAAEATRREADEPAVAPPPPPRDAAPPRERPAAWRRSDNDRGSHASKPEAVPAGRQPGDATAAADRATSPFVSPREWLGSSADDPIRRLGLALVAWPPIGLAAAAAIGEVTGCTTFAAACGGTDSILPWLAQAGILGLLLLLPPFARLLAAGTVAVVLALVPATALLVALGGTGQPEAGFALAFLLGAVWLVGVAWAVVIARRRTPGMSAGARS